MNALSTMFIWIALEKMTRTPPSPSSTRKKCASFFLAHFHHKFFLFNHFKLDKNEFLFSFKNRFAITINQKYGPSINQHEKYRKKCTNSRKKGSEQNMKVSSVILVSQVHNYFFWWLFLFTWAPNNLALHRFRLNFSSIFTFYTK